jgi:hypothetical protein
MGKASELDSELERQPLTAEELAVQGGRPTLEVRLRADALTRLEGRIAVGDALEVLEHAGGASIELSDFATGLRGILVPVDRYVQLLALELGSGEMQAESDGRIRPTRLEDSDIEQVNPADTWLPVPGHSSTDR